MLNIPNGLDLKSAAPILCAGITTYSPLNHWNIGAGDKVAIVGIGGLGHMAVMIAKAMGAHVTAITRKEEKKPDAFGLGADEVLVSSDKEAMKVAEERFDYILITIPYAFDINDYIPLLNVRGSITTVGLIGPYKEPTDNNLAAPKGRTIGGSLIGGIAETREVLEFCAMHNIAPHVKMLDIKDINKAFEEIKDDEVRFRYVIDMQSLKQE